MTKRVFLDTNILLDVLTVRGPFYGDAARLWTLAEEGRIVGLISAISFGNCYYVLRKQAGRANADEAMCHLRDAFKPVELTEQILDQAIDAGFSDFEDALQFHSAVHARAECILTRNPDHFPRAPLSVLSPAEFLAVHPFK